MTTHNTMIMEADFARDATYVLYEEVAGHKVIRCVTDYEKRTYLANNIRNKYLNNEYGGLPEIREIDFDFSIKKCLLGLKMSNLITICLLINNQRLWVRFPPLAPEKEVKKDFWSKNREISRLRRPLDNENPRASKFRFIPIPYSFR